MSKSEEIPKNFWNKFKKADYFERKEILKPIAKIILELNVISDEHLKINACAGLLQSYFEDLINSD
jgi:hypothetical protein